MNQVEPADAASSARHTGWDAAVAALLGIALLGAGWLDARTYLAHRGNPLPPFDFLSPDGSEHLGQNEIYRSFDTFALLENIGALEKRDGPLFRFAYGPASTILLTSTHPFARLNIAFYNDIPDQEITIRCNETVLEQLTHQGPGPTARSYRLALHAGTNTVSIGFARYNHGPLDLHSPDPRPLAGSIFQTLALTPE